MYIGIAAVIVNLVIVLVLTVILNAAKVSNGTDETLPQQYTADPETAPAPVPADIAVAD